MNNGGGNSCHRSWGSGFGNWDFPTWGPAQPPHELVNTAMQCWTGFSVLSCLRDLPAHGSGKGFFCQDRICHFGGSAPFFFFFLILVNYSCIQNFNYFYYSGKKIVSQRLCFYLFISLWALNFDLENQREVGVWGAPGPGVCPGHCSIGGHVLTLGRVRLYCKREYRGNSFIFTTPCHILLCYW